MPITGVVYVTQADWSYNATPPNVFNWSKVTLRAGNYRWHVLVTVNGKTNTMYDRGTLTVRRR